MPAGVGADSTLQKKNKALKCVEQVLVPLAVGALGSGWRPKGLSEALCGHADASPGWIKNTCNRMPSMIPYLKRVFRLNNQSLQSITT